jgi:hypothetical protein
LRAGWNCKPADAGSHIAVGEGKCGINSMTLAFLN